MKLLSFVRDGAPTYGCLVDGCVIDLGRHFGSRAPDLKALIAAELVAEARAHASNVEDRLTLEGLALLPVIPNPGKIICVGLNYHEHVKETQRQTTEHPTLFLRVAESQVGHNQPLVRPIETAKFDYEGEIALVIGKSGRRIGAAQAWDHIAGYACYNDGSVRDWQAASNQWTAGKNFWHTGGFGPWMVTADEIAPGQELTLITRVNGQEMQRATTAMLIHSIPELLRHISVFTPLDAGDVIVTGTPGGIGARRTPPVFLSPGDVVEIEVSAIGTLVNEVAAE